MSDQNDLSEALALDESTRLLKKTRSYSRIVTINCRVVVVMSLACAIILGVVLVLSTTIPFERRVLTSVVVGVILFGCQLVLCVSRSDPNTLAIFTTICAFICGLCLGPAIWCL